MINEIIKRELLHLCKSLVGDLFSPRPGFPSQRVWLHNLVSLDFGSLDPTSSYSRLLINLDGLQPDE